MDRSILLKSHVRALVILLIIMAGFVNAHQALSAEYRIARTFTPVLNTPDFGAVFGGKSRRDLKTDRCGQVRELEFIALPGTLFTVVKKNLVGKSEIYQVVTSDYTASAAVGLYVDARFLEPVPGTPVERRPLLPPFGEILSKLRSVIGKPYVWGGNVPTGVPDLAGYYSRGPGEMPERLLLTGLDCSGLLYFASSGWTPRNTSQLLTFGQGVLIQGNSPGEIAEKLLPLDLIVWNGHVIIVLDRNTVIESRLECNSRGNGGVVISPMSDRLAEIMKSRHPSDSWPAGNKRRDTFVIRRWYP